MSKRHTRGKGSGYDKILLLEIAVSKQQNYSGSHNLLLEPTPYRRLLRHASLYQTVFLIQYVQLFPHQHLPKLHSCERVSAMTDAWVKNGVL